MNSKMTPCEKLGYKVGDKFEVIEDSVYFKKGDIVSLKIADNSSCPFFINEKVVRDGYSKGCAMYLSSVKKISKLKPAKRALADAIHQNGGWPKECHWMFATSNGFGGAFCWTNKPKRSGLNWLGGGKFTLCCEIGASIPNWHQCILSREEYYHAYPKADADGWIEWKGGMKSPVESGAPVDVKTKDGYVHYDQLLGDACWRDNWGDANIISYRLHNPEVKPEFCESVTRSIPEPESIDGLCAKVTEENKHQYVVAKPTIEQLAQDYRNKLDFAKRKQQEADDAKAEADAALVELERAGEALGLLIGIAKPGREPGFVITDWRDLQVNDVVFVGECDGYESGEYVVVWLEDGDYDGDFAVIVVGIDGIERCMDTAMEWRFIRRQ